MQQTAPSNSEIRLFRHVKRPQWGVAAFLWERNTKRGYQFSDGKVRVFKEGFYHLFESTAAPGDGSAKAVRRAARVARANSVFRRKRMPTLRDQISMFRRAYPEGFRGDAWTKKYRGEGARKRLKRHRDAAIHDARELRVVELEPLILACDWQAVYDRLVEVANGTTLVTAAHRKKLAKLRPSRELSLALHEWLACESLDDDEAQLRFNRLIRQLGTAATWPIISMIGGLVHPERHTCVRPSVFKQQGTMLVKGFSVNKRPSFRTYQRYVEMSTTVFDELEAAGLQPRDLLDVYDFIWETLRPAARDELLVQPDLPPLEPIEADDKLVDIGSKKGKPSEPSENADENADELDEAA